MHEAQDADALEHFLAERGTQLMRTAVLLAGGRQDGEDLMQAALERLLRQGGRIQGNPEGYLRRTLYNLATDWLAPAGEMASQASCARRRSAVG